MVRLEFWKCGCGELLSHPWPGVIAVRFVGAHLQQAVFATCGGFVPQIFIETAHSGTFRHILALSGTFPATRALAVAHSGTFRRAPTTRRGTMMPSRN